MLIREIGAHYEYSWRSISGKASMMKEAKPNWQQVDFPSESVTAVTATSEKEVDTLTRMSNMNERQNKSRDGNSEAKKCHRCCLSSIVGARTTNQAAKKDKQAPECARNPGAVTDQGNLSVRLRSGRSRLEIGRICDKLKIGRICYKRLGQAADRVPPNLPAISRLRSPHRLVAKKYTLGGVALKPCSITSAPFALPSLGCFHPAPLVSKARLGLTSPFPLLGGCTPSLLLPCSPPPSLLTIEIASRWPGPKQSWSWKKAFGKSGL